MMDHISYRTINRRFSDPLPAIAAEDALFRGEIAKVAAYVEEHYLEKPIILLAGPSGSGKTTSALLLEKYLDASGHETHTISLDNYFLSVCDVHDAYDENGEVDLESPKCLDTELLYEQMAKIAACERVDVPVFDFKTQSRSGDTVPLKRKPSEIVIFEGIHALNPIVMRKKSIATALYVAVNTAVRHNDFTLTPDKVRLLRRLSRDKNHRAQSYAETLGRFASVSRGERLYIDPYKRNADFKINSFHSYELSVYRDLLLPGLCELSEETAAQYGIADIVSLLSDLRPISTEIVPRDSLINEFLY